MKEHEIRQAITGPQPIIIEQPRSVAGPVLSVADFGACGTDDRDNYEAFRAAIKYCKEVKAPALVVPKGIYHFRTVPEAAEEAQIHFEGLTDFTFDGQDAEFVFSAVHNFVQVKDCERVRLHSFRLDWDWNVGPLASVGIVKETAADGSWFDCLFPSLGDAPETMSIQIAGPMDPLSLTPGCKDGVEYRPFANPYIKRSENDHDGDAAMAELVRELAGIVQRMEKKGPQTLRFHMTDPSWCKSAVKPGQAYNFRHYEYNAPAFVVGDGAHLTFEGITIYSCPGNGFAVGGDVHHFRFHDCRVAIKPGTGRSISCATDCFHISYSQGQFIIEGCDFSGAGDDCINIHDNTSMGVIRISERQLIAERVAPVRNPIREGDLLEFRNRDFSPSGFASRVIDYLYDVEKRQCLLTLEDEIPADLDAQAIVFNRRFDTSGYIIRNNSFHSNRARGMLIHGSNGRIEGNRFYKLQGAAVHIEAGAESRWSEGFGVSNLIFRNNWIESCDVNCWSMAVLYMGVYLPGGRTDYPAFQKILIEDNTFVNCPRQAMYLSSVSHLVVKGNFILNSNREPLEGQVFGSSTKELPIYGERYDGVIMISRASHVVVEDNRRMTTVERQEYGEGLYLERIIDEDTVHTAHNAI